MKGSFDGFMTIKPLEPKLIPPRGAKAVGIHSVPGQEDRIIYEMKVLDGEATKASKVQAVDADGQPLYRKHNGEKIVPIMKMDFKFRTKRFILRPFQSGKVKAIENFALTPEQEKDRRDREAKDRWMDDLRDEAIKAGISPQDIVSKLLASVQGPDEIVEPNLDSLSDEERELLGVGGMQPTPLPFDVNVMSLREIQQAVKEVELSAEQKALMSEAEAQNQNRKTVLDTLA